MYRNHCCCGAVTLEVDAGMDITETASHSQTANEPPRARLVATDKDIIVDAEPSALGCLEIFPGQRQYFCNICANTLYTRFDDGNISVKVPVAGNDEMPQQLPQHCEV